MSSVNIGGQGTGHCSNLVIVRSCSLSNVRNAANKMNMTSLISIPKKYGLLASILENSGLSASK